MRWQVKRRTGRARPVVARLTATAAILGGAAFLALEIRLLANPPSALVPAVPGDPGATATATGQFRSVVIQLGIALGAVVALLYTARTYRLARRGQVTDRFTKALERLGSSEPYVRVGAIHALEHVMRDSAEHHSDVVELLVAFLQDNLPPRRQARPAGLWNTGNDRWMHPPAPGDDVPAIRTDAVPRTPGDVQVALTALANRPRRPYSERVTIRLAGFDLRGADLLDADLAGADLTGADLSGARLRDADLTGALLAGADLSRADLTSSVLVRAVLRDAILPYAVLRDARMTRVDLAGADLREAHLDAATLYGGSLAGADLTGASLRAAGLSGTDLTGAGLRNANLDGADLAGAIIVGTELSGDALETAVTTRPPESSGHVLRAVVTWINLTSLLGVAVAKLGGARLVRSGRGALIAENYRLRRPRQSPFTIGVVIVTRRSAAWLLDDARGTMLDHELRHCTQYAVLGLLFLPLYLVGAVWSFLTTGSYSNGNPFELHAGLAAGGYRQTPVRPWVTRLRRLNR